MLKTLRSWWNKPVAKPAGAFLADRLAPQEFKDRKHASP